MDEVSTIGIDIAKCVFQLHGVDGAGEVVLPDGYAGVRWSAFLPLWRAALSVSRLAAPRTSGRGRSPAAGMMCA